MDSELQNFLEQSCPSVFSDGCYVECGDGWFLLLFNLCRSLEKLDLTVKAAQIKEKFGGLRFYASHDPEDPRGDEVADLILAAEQLSFVTCEDCGRSGERRTPRGYTRTLCEKCF